MTSSSTCATSIRQVSCNRLHLTYQHSKCCSDFSLPSDACLVLTHGTRHDSRAQPVWKACRTLPVPTARSPTITPPPIPQSCCHLEVEAGVELVGQLGKQLERLPRQVCIRVRGVQPDDVSEFLRLRAHLPVHRVVCLVPAALAIWKAFGAGFHAVRSAQPDNVAEFFWLRAHLPAHRVICLIPATPHVQQCY